MSDGIPDEMSMLARDAVERLERERDYHAEKCAKALRELDEARATISTDADHHVVQLLAMADQRNTEADRADAAEAELAECRRLAFLAERGATAEEKLLAASCLIARLVRTSDGTRAAGEALATFATADNTNRETS